MTCACGRELKASYSFSPKVKNIPYCPKCTARRALVNQKKAQQSEKVNQYIEKKLGRKK